MSIGEIILSAFMIIVVMWIQLVNKKINRIHNWIVDGKYVRNKELKKFTQTERTDILKEMSKQFDHLALKRGIKDQPRLTEEILVYIDTTILRPYTEE